MISFFTTRILDFLKFSEAIECDENNLDIYKYGIEITLSTILNILIILILSLIYGSFFTGIIFLLVFIPLRKFTGGYHADTYMKCNIVFAILYTSVFWLTKILYKYTDVHIIEAMGRNAGWLTAASALARDGDSVAPHLIYLPEIPFSVDKFVDDVKGKLDEYNSVIVVVSEGIKDENGEYISARGDKVDKFGHVMLSGTGAYLKSVVEERIGCKVRALEPSVLQRSAGHTASMTDVTEAYNLGVVAVKAALDGKTGVFSTLRRISDLPYTVDYYTEQVSVVANNEKLVPRSWINEQGNDVTNKMIEYLSPLVKGVPQVPYRNGLPDYIGLSHLDVKKQKYSD